MTRSTSSCRPWSRHSRESRVQAIDDSADALGRGATPSSVHTHRGSRNGNRPGWFVHGRIACVGITVRGSVLMRRTRSEREKERAWDSQSFTSRSSGRTERSSRTITPSSSAGRSTRTTHSATGRSPGKGTPTPTASGSAAAWQRGQLPIMRATSPSTSKCRTSKLHSPRQRAWAGPASSVPRQSREPTSSSGSSPIPRAIWSDSRRPPRSRRIGLGGAGAPPEPPSLAFSRGAGR
jgi:hypothetical protein